MRSRGPLESHSATLLNAYRPKFKVRTTSSKRSLTSNNGQNTSKASRGSRERVLDYFNANLATFNSRLNEITGYDRVEGLKTLVGAKEASLNKQRQIARDAKSDYQTAISMRSRAQQDVNNLLERKHSWSDHDVSLFTSLVRSDHAANSAVTAASAALSDAEAASDKAFSELMRTILERYHEEHTWSDKIRYISTWANAVGLFVNLVVFIGAVTLVEPWKRKRIVKNLEDQLESLVTDLKGELRTMEAALASSLGVPALKEDGLNALRDECQQHHIRHPWYVPVWSNPWDLENWTAARRDLSANFRAADMVSLAACGLTAGIAIYASS